MSEGKNDVGIVLGLYEHIDKIEAENASYKEHMDERLWEYHDLEKRLAELIDEVRRLRAALEFYADRENYQIDFIGDYGKRARKALEKSEQ